MKGTEPPSLRSPTVASWGQWLLWWGSCQVCREDTGEEERGEGSSDFLSPLTCGPCCFLAFPRNSQEALRL